jgi:hypothetical protein
MKTKYWLLILLFLALPLMVLAQTNDVDMTQLALDTAAKLNAVSAPVNPYAGPIGIVLGILGSIWGIFKHFKTAKKEQQLAIVVKGVEISGNLAVKQNIKSLADAAGAAKELDAAVQTIVGK